ncbi:MAG: hypothetical protein IJ302_08705 [Clostridia bacterium]|nr:hypothetical protein [Clostridia bacterium]
MKHTKLVSFFLASLLMTAAITACGGDNTAVSDNTGADTTAAAVETEPAGDDIFSARLKVADELPEKDFGGRVFRLLNDGHAGSFAEQDGDVVNDAIFARNLTVQERFNVTFEDLNQGTGNDTKAFVIQAVNAGDDAFELVMTHSITAGDLALEDYYQNWYEIPYINFEKPWWAATTRENLTVDGVCPLAIGDYALMSYGQTVCMYFNKQLIENYDLSDPYQLVREGKWTYPTLISMTKDIYEDKNLDGTVDVGDLFGVSLDAQNRVNMFYWAFDNPLMATENGELKITYRTEKLTAFITALNNDFYTNTGCVVNTEFKESALPDFMAGNVVFQFGMFRDATWIRGMEDDFGILPLPKWDEAQENYYSYSSGSAPVLAVPTTAADTEFIGIITEALNAESYKQVVPVYYETALKDKYARDEETLEMIDIVMQGRFVDIGFIYDGFVGAGYIPARLVQKNDNNVESYIEKNEKTINARYDQIIEYFSTYKDTH